MPSELRDGLKATAAALDDYLDLARSVAALAGGPAAPRRASGRHVPADTLRRVMRDFLRAYAKQQFEIVVPGEHYSGLSNRKLFGILHAQGREFLRVTPQMVDHARRELEHAFGATAVVPLRIEVDEVFRAAVEEWVLARMEGRIGDVRRRVLTQRYARWKSRKFPGRPIGTLRGRLVQSLTRLRVHFKR